MKPEPVTSEPVTSEPVIQGPVAPDAVHLLVVDDDDRIRTLLQRFLVSKGFRVAIAANAGDARAQMARLAFDLVILDVMMPGEDGLSLLHFLRSTRGPPVLMLSARGEVESRIEGLAAGADDYLGKPFEPEELALRIGAVLRRREASEESAFPRVRFGTAFFDGPSGELRISGETVPLTDKEVELLRLLAREFGRPVSREALAEAMGGLERSVDVAVTRLRRKIEADADNPVFVRTVRGIGYVLTADSGT